MVVLRAAARRLAVFLGTVLVASLVIFLMMQALPGDVAQVALGMGASPEKVEELRQTWGLNRPLAVRYFEWLGGMLHFDFGSSLVKGQPVVDQIRPRLGVTAWLVGLSIPLSLLVAIPMGLTSAMLRRRASGALINALSHVGLALPVFFLGAVASMVFAVKLQWLPANGYRSFAQSPGEWALRMILPVGTLVIVQSCFLARYVRTGFIDVLSEDYYRTARASGWTKWRGLIRHGMRNMATSLVTVVGLQVSSLLVGAVLIEQVFVLPGLGSLLVQSVGSRDLMVVQAVVMLLVFAVLAINFLVDLLYLWIDPRLRRGKTA
ncbi:MAG: ABC transporter permease [Propionibacteriaceae bacterium]|nr:ABC transporter permease [Propionibacteriaceae bacterium]